MIKKKEESEKTGLKLTIQKTNIASGPITSWQINRATVEIATDPMFLDSKIILDSGCSCEIKRCLFFGRKAMTNLDSVLKSRDITLPTKVRIVKAMVFPVVMYGCELDHKEGWTLKPWSFQIVVLEKTLESTLNVKTIKSERKSTLNTYWKDWCWSWYSSTLATWLAELPLWKKPWYWERLKAKEGDDKGWDG